MQPHYNLGIRFRTHFQPFGISKKRISNKLHDELQGHINALKEGRITWADIKDTVKDLYSVIKRLGK